MVWDKNTPTGDELISVGDDRIRELKQDLETAFKVEFGNDWDGSVDKSVHNLLDLPDLSLENQIKLRQYLSTDFYSLDIFINNNWIKGTQIFEFPVNAILVVDSNTSFFGWEFVALSHSYMLVLHNQITFSDTGYSPHETVFDGHLLYGKIVEHSHTASGSTGDTSHKTDVKRIWEYGNVWKKEHRHSVAVSNINTVSIIHDHTAYSNNFNLATKYCRLIKRIL